MAKTYSFFTRSEFTKPLGKQKSEMLSSLGYYNLKKELGIMGGAWGEFEADRLNDDSITMM